MITEKSLEEVLAWKDAVYNDTKDMNKEQKPVYFREKTTVFLKSHGYRKEIVSGNIYKLIKED